VRKRLGGAVEVSASEYPVLLERVYRAEKFPKPRNVIGIVKGLPAEEMEKLILANSTVDEEDLRDLAERRAKAVVDWLIAHEVPAERLFRLPAKLVAARGAGGRVCAICKGAWSGWSVIYDRSCRWAGRRRQKPRVVTGMSSRCR
jgi:hypothetical protein